MSDASSSQPTSPSGEAAHRSAALLRRAGRAARAAIYVPHRDGGFVLWATDNKPNAGARSLEQRLHWNGTDGWLWGGDGFYMVLPLGTEGSAGIALIGPWPREKVGIIRSRVLQHARARATQELIVSALATTIAGDTIDATAERAASEMLAGDADQLRALLLRAVRLEAGATDARWHNGALVLGDEVLMNAPLAILERALRRVGEAQTIEAVRLATLVALADAVDARSPATAGHGIRAAEIAREIAAVISDDFELQRTVELAARVQNVAQGFCGIDALSKARLDDAEQRLVRAHTTLGAALITSAQLSEDVAASVRAHHERWDGEGYPDRAAGEAIPIAARIVNLADTVDALVSPRPWREAMLPLDALREIREAAGKQFDPGVVAAFERTRYIHELAERGRRSIKL